ncbi:MAG: DUF3857 domain-containing protein [Akkermansiaceae bacterium]|nr:DUF3857 domain-containing protein [Akkermansiaceae bacterium]
MPVFARFVCFASGLGLFGAGPAWGQAPSVEMEAGFRVGPAPDWVTPLEAGLDTPPPFSDSARGGIFFRLVDLQTNAETVEAYTHYTDEYTSAAGVHENGELEIEIDPSYQTLTLHRIDILRAGRRIDALRPDLVRRTQPEDELAEGMLDGHVTFLILLPDLRPGDVLDYDYTIAGDNPAFEGRFFDTVSLNWETWVRRVRYRLLKKPERPIFTRNRRTDIAPRRANGPGGLEEWIWEASDAPPVILEDNLPGDHDPFASVEVGEFETWEEVAAWAAPFYDFSAETPDPELARMAESLNRGGATDDERILAAIRFVQDEVRYLGLEDGRGAYCPASPNRTFRNRFGDCKDKTVLLHRLLGEMGVESAPAFVNFDERGAVADRLPSPLAFDHVVLRIRRPNGKFLWCDTTNSHQGGTAETLAFTRFGKALVPGEGLVEIPARDPEADGAETVDTVKAPELGKPGELESVTVYRGADADSARYYFDSEPPESVNDGYLSGFRQEYDDVELAGPVEIEDDRTANRLTVTVKYRFATLWEEDKTDPGWFSFFAYLRGIRNVIDQPDHIERTMPYALEFPKNRRHEVRFFVPGRGKDWDFEPEEHFIEAPGVEFSREVSYRRREGLLTFSGSLKILRDRIEPAELREYRDRTSEMYELTAFDIWDASDDLDAAADGDEGYAEGGLDEDWEWWFAIGMGVLVIGAIGFGLGAIVTLFATRHRRKAHAAGDPLPAPAVPGRSPRPGPPPLPR